MDSLLLAKLIACTITGMIAGYLLRAIHANRKLKALWKACEERMGQMDQIEKEAHELRTLIQGRRQREIPFPTRELLEVYNIKPLAGHVITNLRVWDEMPKPPRIPAMPDTPSESVISYTHRPRRPEDPEQGDSSTQAQEDKLKQEQIPSEIWASAGGMRLGEFRDHLTSAYIVTRKLP